MSRLRDNRFSRRMGDTGLWERRRAGLLQREALGGTSAARGGRANLRNVFAAVLFAVLAVMMFAALAAGTGAFRAIAADGQAASQQRLGTSLLANTVRGADAADAVSAAEGPEGPALVLSEHLDTGDFETRLYLSDGWIVQEYAPAGAEYSSDAATRMVESQTFSFQIEPSAVRLSCDEGETLVALRSAGAVSASADAVAGGAAGSDAEGGERHG